MAITNQSFDLIVYGATPAGIAAAIASSRRGKRTLLLEPSAHVGGMMTSGLGRTDIRSLESSGGIFREFAEGVLQHYTLAYGADSVQVKECNGGLWFEPGVAMDVLQGLLRREERITLMTGTELTEVETERSELRAITVSGPGDRSGSRFAAELFIDATYEGDLAAMAGAPYKLGRESRDEWGEEYAGKLYMDFHPSKEVFPGSTGEGDDRIQAYNYRLCLTDRANNRIEFRKPDPYDRERYASLPADVREGRIGGIRDVLNMLPIPNGKTDSNNHHYCMCSSDLPEENFDYIEADPRSREKVVERHRSYVEGLLWFLQNDEELPESFRLDAGRWGHAADEFAESGHFPPQLYVREARRIEGEYMFTENDARIAPGSGRAPVHADSIAIGDYPIDSHATRKREPEGRNIALEGFLALPWLTAIYQIPYGCMVPKRVERLLVPTAVSATHMGLGTIRMEPVWMQLGFAAGTAVALSLEFGCGVRELSVDRLQDELLAIGQRITYFRDASAFGREGGDMAQVAAEYFGAKGMFGEYEASLEEPVTVKEASAWIALIRRLDGGAGLPVLPASPTLLKAGIDMGPRLPKSEIMPPDYWAAHPLLTSALARIWLAATERAWEVSGETAIRDDAEYVSRGNFLACLYERLKKRRRGAAEAR
jgi:hypothetical protein